MKVVGIIAEFNPFHNGHKYLIDEIKAKTEADYVVICMSGSFVQRGTPACMYKYTRTIAALTCGVDLVLEIPVSYSTATAETFAFGGVSILNSLNCIDYIAFGSEDGNIDILNSCAEAISSPDDVHNSLIEEALKKGMSYPAARAKAFPEYSNILDKPNNILAIEYLKALKRLNSQITPVTIPRLGAGYHETNMSDLPSAEGIRNMISNGVDINTIQGIPSELLELYSAEISNKWPIYFDDYTELVKYMLLTNTADSLSNYQDMNIDIARRLIKAYRDCKTITDLLQTVKSKELTYSRYSRALLHSLLALADYTKDNNGSIMQCPYTRILGFNSKASELMHEVAHNSTIPLINKAGDASNILSAEALALFEATCKADRLYDMILNKKYGTHLKDGCLISPIIM